MGKPPGIRVDALKRIRVKYKGVFNFREVYRDIQEWFQDKGFATPDTFKFQETQYQERRFSSRMNRTAWVWIRLKSREEESAPGTAFYERHLDIEYHCRYLKNVDVMFEGKKFTMQKGEIEILFHSYLVLDPDGGWQKHWFLKHIMDLYIKRIWAKRLEVNINRLRSDTYYIQSHLKDFFKMKTLQRPVSRFYPQLVDHSSRM